MRKNFMRKNFMRKNLCDRHPSPLILNNTDPFKCRFSLSTFSHVFNVATLPTIEHTSPVSFFTLSLPNM